MGIGSSSGYYAHKPRRLSQAIKPRRHAGKKRRRGFFRKIRPAPTTLPPIIPIKYRPPRRYSYGAYPFVPPMPAYVPLPSPVYPRYMPLSYNNYAAQYYSSPLHQPVIISPQQFQPMAMPQQAPQYQPMMMPQQVPQFRPMPVPQQVSPPVFSPYIYSPYSTGVPFSMPYARQQPQVAPVYNNVGVSSPLSTGMIGQSTPYSYPYQASNRMFTTDWTGGGQISPGFLGPPI